MIQFKKRLIVISICVLSLTGILRSQTIFVGGTINSNTTWVADTVKIIADLTINPGVSLTVNPGTFVESMGYYKINVQGKIRAIGTVTDTIVFTNHDTTGLFTDSTSSAGGWGGFNITGNINSTDTSIFHFCRLQYGKKFNLYTGDIKGGLFYVDGHGGLIFTHCLITRNLVLSNYTGVNGPAGGAIYCKNVHYILIDSNSFVQNRSLFFGGAIYIYQGCDSIMITHNLFFRNKAIHFQSSGGFMAISGSGAAVYTFENIYNSYSTPTIANNKCFNNESVDGQIETCNSKALVYNNLVCNGYGIGFEDQMVGSYSRVFSNTIANNWTSLGAMYFYSYAKVYNNICWGNKHQYASIVPQIVVCVYGFPSLFYNCVQYGNGGDSAIYLYPDFAQPTAGFGPAYDASIADWSLNNASSSINKGTPDTSSLFIPELDIAGQSRVFGNRIDIGAYENQIVWVGGRTLTTANNELLVSPNPSSGEFCISLGKSCKHSVVDIFSMDGKKILVEQFINPVSMIRISLQDANPGVYLLQITTEFGIQRSKVIIAK